MSLNRTILQGRMVRNPELNSTPSGIFVCSFTVAWSKKYQNKETKLFQDCVVWRGLAEFVSRNFQKGNEIIVEGELFTEQWTDRKGNKRYSNTLTVESVHFCGPKFNKSQETLPENHIIDDDISDFNDVIGELDDNNFPYEQ